MSEILDIEITPAELAARIDVGETMRLLDVRERWEFDHAHLEGAEFLPLGQLMGLLAETVAWAGTASTVICYCHLGIRSLTAADWLRRAGVPGARSLAGGIDRWAREIDPSLPRY